MNNVIQSGMSAMASLNPSAVEAVGGQAVHISSTEAALVGLAKGGCQGGGQQPTRWGNRPSIGSVRRLEGYSTMLQAPC